MHRGNDATVIEAQTISGVDAFRLRRNTGVMQGTVQPIAGLVSGEHATSSVGSIRSGCQADDCHLGHRIPERGYGSSPIRFIAPLSALADRLVLPPLDEARTCPAHRNRGVKVGEFIASAGDLRNVISVVGDWCPRRCQVSWPAGSRNDGDSNKSPVCGWGRAVMVTSQQFGRAQSGLGRSVSCGDVGS